MGYGRFFSNGLGEYCESGVGDTDNSQPIEKVVLATLLHPPPPTPKPWIALQATAVACDYAVDDAYV